MEAKLKNAILETKLLDGLQRSIIFILPPMKLRDEYTSFTLSVRLSVRPSIRPPSVWRPNRVRSVSSTILAGSISYLICRVTSIGICMAIHYVMNYTLGFN